MRTYVINLTKCCPNASLALKKSSKFITCIDDFTYSNYEAFCSLLEVWLFKIFVSHLLFICLWFK